MNVILTDKQARTYGICIYSDWSHFNFEMVYIGQSLICGHGMSETQTKFHENQFTDERNNRLLTGKLTGGRTQSPRIY